jgi:hypothetical protein
MSEVDLIKILLGTQSALAGMFVWHLFRCRDTRIDIATICKAIERIEHEIGDHERGIRGQLHQHSQFLTRHEMDLDVMRSKR